MQAPSSLTFPGFHSDVIHDVAYDFYGKRMATCSADQSIKIWDVEEDGTWRNTAHMSPSSNKWRGETSSGHHREVWKLTWAHPEFGQVLASCAIDGSVCIWQEIAEPPPAPPAGEQSDPGCAHWIIGTVMQQGEQNMINETNFPTDLQFAPRHLQKLVLAVASCSGDVFMYEPSIDTQGNHINMSAFELMQGGESCHRLYRPGTPGTQGEAGAASGAAGLGGARGGAGGWGKTGGGGGGGGGGVTARQDHQHTCISWNPSPYSPPMLAVGRSNGSVHVFELLSAGWEIVLQLSPPPLQSSPSAGLGGTAPGSFGGFGGRGGGGGFNQQGGVGGFGAGAASNLPAGGGMPGSSQDGRCYDVAWAPNMGRSFEMIAAACADRPIMLWQIARRSEANGLAGSADSAGGGGDSSGGGGEDDETDPWVIVGPAVELSEDDTGRQQQPSLGAGAMAPRSKVFRVEWNVTGTILASSADDGTVKLWKAVMSGADGKKWVSASIVTDEDSTR